MTEEIDNRGRMAGPDRQRDGVASGASAAWNRGGARGPAVGLDRRSDAAAAGHVAGRRRQNARACLRDEKCRAVALVINSPGGSPVQSRQIYLADSATRRGKETTGVGVRRGCRGIRRLHDRLRGRRNLLRSIVDPGLDRRRRRLLRISGSDKKDRRRAAAVYGGRAQGDARSVPAGKPRRCRTRQSASAARSTPSSSRW